MWIISFSTPSFSRPMPNCPCFINCAIIRAPSIFELVILRVLMVSTFVLFLLLPFSEVYLGSFQQSRVREIEILQVVLLPYMDLLM